MADSTQTNVDGPSVLGESTALPHPPTATVNAPLPKIIPATYPGRPRTVVLCFDGTGDQFDADNSNVIQFFSLLQKDDPTKQRVYYQAGIGTYTVPQIATPFWANISKNIDMAIAWNLDAHVMDGYVFLMQNYQAGDKICIFGFSRGAYTARSLAGMIHKVGLLPADNHQQVPFAYKMFTKCDERGWQQSVAFKKAFSINVDIEFVGVWDTVCSVGLIPRRLPFVSSNTAIRYFRHALSLDERRAKFKANTYNRPTKEESELGVQLGEMPTPTKDGTLTPVTVNGQNASVMGMWETVRHSVRWNDGDKTLTDSTLKIFNEFVESMQDATHSRSGSESSIDKGKSPQVHTKPKQKPKKQKSVDSNSDEDDARHEIDFVDLDGDGINDDPRTAPDNKRKVADTDVLEVWFAGCHCDVGGGSVKNGTRHNLARIPLRWMIRQCFLANTGIRFHSSMLPNVGLDPRSLYPVVQERPRALYVSSLQAGTPLIPRAVISSIPTQDIHTKLPPSPQPIADDASLSAIAAAPLVASASMESNKTLASLTETAISSKMDVNEWLQKLRTEPGELTEEEEDLADALSPIYDQLSLAKGWWSLEIIPMMQRYQTVDDKWVEKLMINLGRGRSIPNPKPPVAFNVHRSVDIRMQATGYVLDTNGKVVKDPYAPKAKYKVNPEWVA